MKWFGKKPVHVELPGLQRTVDDAVQLAHTAARTVLGDQWLILALVNEKIALLDTIECHKKEILDLLAEREQLHAALAQRDIQIDSHVRARANLEEQLKQKRAKKKKVAVALFVAFLAFAPAASYADESDDCAVEDDDDTTPAPTPFIYTVSGVEC